MPRAAAPQLQPHSIVIQQGQFVEVRGRPWLVRPFVEWVRVPRMQGAFLIAIVD
jgi:hypothetical protein